MKNNPSTPEDRGRLTAKYLYDIFKKRPRIGRDGDENENSVIDMAIWDDIPEKGTVLMMTLTLSHYPLIEYGAPYTKGRAELMSICRKKDEDIFRSILSTCTFCVINSQWFVAPRTIFPNVVEMYDKTLQMKHIYFGFPLMFRKLLSNANIDGISTEWLSIIPISEAEYQFAINHSVEELSYLLEKHNIDYMDLNRKSVI
jgi:hypothetical protein